MSPTLFAAELCAEVGFMLGVIVGELVGQHVTKRDERDLAEAEANIADWRAAEDVRLWSHSLQLAKESAR